MGKVGCFNCVKLHTKYCPIRVWGRNEDQKELRLDVDLDKDFCTRWKEKICKKEEGGEDGPKS